VTGAIVTDAAHAWLTLPRTAATAAAVQIAAPRRILLTPASYARSQRGSLGVIGEGGRNPSSAI
jgi:hypothetical protein